MKRSITDFSFEALAIIFSILVAFAIDSAWDRHQERQEVDAALEALYADFSATAAGLEVSIEQIRSDIADYLDILSLPLEDLERRDPRELTQLVQRSVVVSTFLPPTVSLDTLVASGRLNIIDDLGLRNALVAYRSSVESLNRTQAWILEFSNTQYIPYLRTKVPMTTFGWNGPVETVEEQLVGPNLSEDELRHYLGELFGDMQFLNLVQNRLMGARLTDLKLRLLVQDVGRVCDKLGHGDCYNTLEQGPKG